MIRTWMVLCALVPTLMMRADGQVASKPQVSAKSRIVGKSGEFSNFYGYSVGNGQAVMHASSVTNTGSAPAQFRFALWWGPNAPYPSAGSETAYFDLGIINAGETISGNSGRTAVPFTNPGEGCYYVALLLQELVGGNWQIVDSGPFDLRISSGVGCAMSFSASPATILPGGSSTLSWTSGGTSVTIDNGVGLQAPNGSVVVHPAQTTSYTMTVNGTADTFPRTRATTVSVAVAPTIALLANPSSITSGGSSTLTWSSNNATSVTINHGVGTVATSGTISVSPSQTTTYTATATGPAGSVSSQATVTVTSSCGPPVVTAISAVPSPVIAGESVSLTIATTEAVSSYEWYRSIGTEQKLIGQGQSMTIPQVESVASYWVRLRAACNPSLTIDSAPVTVTLNTGTCSSPNDLCVNNNRYRVTLTARNAAGATAKGVALYQTNLFGFFSLPAFTNDAKNPEVFMKVLGPVNGVPWFFFSGLTNLDYTINVYDAFTGQAVKEFRVVPPPAGSRQSKGDYDVAGARSTHCDDVTVTTRVDNIPICETNASTLCLFNNRFAVKLTAKDDPKRTGRTAAGRALPRSDAFGFFSIPDLSNDPTNLEVFVKMVDARALDGHFWVFLGGLTDLEYTLSVTDTFTAKTKVYTKPLSSTCGWNDTAAFP